MKFLYRATQGNVFASGETLRLIKFGNPVVIPSILNYPSRWETSEGGRRNSRWEEEEKVAKRPHSKWWTWGMRIGDRLICCRLREGERKLFFVPRGHKQDVHSFGALFFWNSRYFLVFSRWDKLAFSNIFNFNPGQMFLWFLSVKILNRFWPWTVFYVRRNCVIAAFV